MRQSCWPRAVAVIVGVLAAVALTAMDPPTSTASAAAARSSQQMFGAAEVGSLAAAAAGLGSDHASTGPFAWDGQSWAALAAPVSNGSTYVEVLRWNQGAWALQGAVVIADLYAIVQAPLSLREVAIGEPATAAPVIEVLTGASAAQEAAFVAETGQVLATIPFAVPGGVRQDTVVGGLVSDGAVGDESALSGATVAQWPVPLHWYRLDAGEFRPAPEPGPAPECTTGALPASGIPGGSYTRVNCHGDYALAVTSTPAGAQVPVLFERAGISWVKVVAGQSLVTTTTAYVVPAKIVQQLAAGFGPQVQPFVQAYALCAHVQALTRPDFPGMGPDAACSAVVAYRNGLWFVSAVAPLRSGSSSMTVYRWQGQSWTVSGRLTDVPGGAFEGPGSIVARDFTGSSAPDFVVPTYMRAVQPLSVISMSAGHWHLLDFATATGPSTVVSGQADGNYITESVTPCGCTVPPAGTTWEGYVDGQFRPVPPPSGLSGCSAAAISGELSALISPMRSPLEQLGQVVCDDGWALGTTPGGGFSGANVTLLNLQEVQGTPPGRPWGWVPLTNDDGADLWQEMYGFGVPASVQLRLISTLHEQDLKPDLAAVELALRLGPLAQAPSEFGGVMQSGGGLWLLDAVQRTLPGPITVRIYAWTAGLWTLEGSVPLPAGSADGVLGDAWYATTTVGNEVGFVVSGLDWTATIGPDASGWRLVTFGAKKI
ncbi:MAG TPA: hypothetical protein VFN61_00875 [Acidimicrobiales bacterium]|nr:hypothetical protein [Acidimicrobiales bacterium]